MREDTKKLGRPPVPEHERRIPCHGIRLPALWLFWLKNQNGSCGLWVEEALKRSYGHVIDKKELTKQFYRRN